MEQKKLMRHLHMGCGESLQTVYPEQKKDKQENNRQQQQGCKTKQEQIQPVG